MGQTVKWDANLLNEGVLLFGSGHIEWGIVTAINTTEKQKFIRPFNQPPAMAIAPMSYSGQYADFYTWGKTNEEFCLFSTNETEVSFTYIAIGN